MKCATGSFAFALHRHRSTIQEKHAGHGWQVGGCLIDLPGCLMVLEGEGTISAFALDSVVNMFDQYLNHVQSGEMVKSIFDGKSVIQNRFM